MVWFFEKNGVYLRLETQVRAESPRFELTSTDEAGREQTVRFETENELLRRYDEITAELRQSGWTGPSTWRI
jgi:hypothetical protein